MTTMEDSPRLLYRDMRSRAEVLTDEIIKEQVLRGIELLDREYGPSWVDHIDPRKLLMEFGDQCVLGQLYGGYDRGCGQLGLNPYGGDEGARAYGFFLLDEDDSKRTWNDLTTAWREVLA